GFRDVVHLEIGEHLVAALHQPVDQLEVAAGDEQLQAELVEARRRPEPLHESTRLGDARHVERDDQPFPAGDLAHRSGGRRNARPSWGARASALSTPSASARSSPGTRWRSGLARNTGSTAVKIAPVSTTTHERYSQMRKIGIVAKAP